MSNFKSWLSGLVAQESGGDYNAVNGRTGAYGKFQIMPENWESWSNEVLGYVGDMKNPQHQEAVAQGKLKQYYDAYGDEGALVAWYAGPVNGERWRDGAPDAIGSNGNHYSWDMKQGGGKEPSVRQYVQEALSKSGNGSYILAGGLNRSQLPLGGNPPIVPTVDPKITDGWAETADKFKDSLYDSTLAGALRLAWSGANETDEYHTGGKPISKEDYDFVIKSLPGDSLAQQYVLMSAKNPQHLSYLVEMKKEDIARRERVENYEMGWSTVGTIAGMIADPLMFVPLGQEAIAVKALARLGKVGSKISMSKLARYAELAATNSALSVAERKGAEVYGGYQQDYTSAAVVGGVAGAGLGLLGDLVRRGKPNKELNKVIGVMENAESHSIAQVTDLRLPNEIAKNTRGDMKLLHDVKFSHHSANFNKLVNNDSLFVVGKNAIKEMSVKLGVDIPAHAKAFYNAAENYAVIIKDNLKPGDSIDNILAHEIGVHGGLKKTFGEKTYDTIMDTVKKRLANPQGIWKKAVKSTPDGGLEEVLGYFMEYSKPGDKIFSRIKSSVNKGLRKLGATADLSDVELKDFVKKSLKAEVERSQGYRILEDGRAVMNNLQFSAANVFHPERMNHIYANETKEITQEGLPFKGFTQWLEAGRLFGNIYGILKNSKSHIGRKLSHTLFHDARMGEYKGSLVMPVEQIKQTIKETLNVHWGNYMDVRSKHLMDNITDGINPVVRAMDFNRQVRECYNAVHSTNRAGVIRKEWDASIREAADVLKTMRDDLVEIGKKSSTMFGTDGKNLIDADWIPNDTEIWRVLDEDKWLTFADKFNHPDEAIDWLSDYAESAVKRDIIEKGLIKDKGKEWDEIIKPEWEKKNIAYQKELEEWEEATAKIEARDEERYEKMLDHWGEQVERWRDKIADLPKGQKKPPKPQKPQRPIDSLKPRKPQEPPALHSRPTTLQDIYKQDLIAKKTSDWWHKVRELKEKGIDSHPPKPKPEDITQEELEAFTEEQYKAHIREEARKWATGIIDRDNSNLEHLKKGGNEGSLSFMRERLPMDTSTVVKTPKGEDFSFDTHLRDDNFDRIIPKVIDRFSGEAALRNVFTSADHFDTVRAKFISDLNHAVGNGDMTELQRKRELDTFDEGISRIRGNRNNQDPKGQWDAFCRMLMNLSYAQNGANMGINQLGEVAGVVAYTGLRGLYHLLPGVADYMNGFKHGDTMVKHIREAELKAFGDNLEARIWQNASHIQSRLFHEVTERGEMMRHLDKVNTAVNYATKLTSTISRLPNLTDRMLRGARSDAMMDTVEWANGKQYSKLRNPFSNAKLKAAGVSQDMAEAIKSDIRKYVYDSQGQQKGNIEKWMNENPATYYKWKFLIDNQGKRAITQSTIGNSNMLKDANSFTKMLFQFKDFTLRAINGQTMRALTSRDADDAMCAALSMVTNGMVYMGLVYGRSWAYHPNNEAKRNAYTEKYASLGEVSKAALLRGVVTGSAASFGWDYWEIAHGRENSFRTTVDRGNRWNKAGNEGYGRLVSDVVTQLPAVRTGANLGGIPMKMYDMAVNDEHMTQRDLRELIRNIPLQNHLLSLYVITKLQEELNLPTK